METAPFTGTVPSSSLAGVDRKAALTAAFSVEVQSHSSVWAIGQSWLPEKAQEGTVVILNRGGRLGPYEILEPIGAGGMGEVYRARDTRLERTVAVKVLSGGFAADNGRKLRFEREARAISGLNHPHICALYDVGEQESVQFLVMEYLEGETLEARLRSGALPLGEALRYAVEMAAALDQAHRHGVIHRDLKPGNVMLTRNGVKLLDFGVARILDAAVAPGSSMPTASQTLTAQGTIMGTYQYMAPEQLEGGDADARSDIFAFGAVVYEMITGQRAFQARSQAGLISAIMSGEPTAPAGGSNGAERTPATALSLSRLCALKG